MWRHSALLVAFLAIAGLSVSVATGDPKLDAFSAEITPAVVKPAALVAYAVQLRNRPTSESARQAKIGIPAGFEVEGESVQATTSPAGLCSSATWAADGALVAAGKINLKWPGESSGELCPGGTLTVTFLAQSASGEQAYAWLPELWRDTTAFELKGGQPTVTVDGTAPDTNIDPAFVPPDPSGSTASSFVFSSNEPSASFQCSLDGTAFAGCSSPSPYAGLADGPHVFRVRATDSAGNSDPSPAAYAWRVDTGPPDTTILAGPPNPSSTNAASFIFSSSEAGSSFHCSLDGSGLAGCASPKSYIGLADGLHTFQVKATDSTGNGDPSPATYSWTVTTTVPDLTPPGNVTGLVAKAGDQVVTLSWTPPADADFDHVRIVRSAGSNEIPVYLGTRTHYSDSTVRNGLRYRYTVISYDHAGNASDGVAASAVPVRPLLAPRTGARVTSPPLLVWSPVPTATYYNVQLYRLKDGLGSRGEKFLSAWPGRARLKLSSEWVFHGRLYRLRPGLYRWYVWPGFGSRRENRYGPLLGQSTFVVAAPGA